MVFFFFSIKIAEPLQLVTQLFQKVSVVFFFFFLKKYKYVTKKIFCMINIKNMKGRLNLSVRRHLWTSEKGSYLEGDRTVIAISTKK